MEIPAKLIENSIKRGTILHSTIFEEIDHGKFFVVIGVYEDSIAGFFFINSNIHPSLFKKPEQLAMQYPLKCADYGFLKYDSFLCATNILVKDRSELAESIGQGVTAIVGEMKRNHLEEVLDMVRVSKLFSKKEKECFFQ